VALKSAVLNSGESGWKSSPQVGQHWQPAGCGRGAAWPVPSCARGPCTEHLRHRQHRRQPACPRRLLPSSLLYLHSSL